MRLLGRRAADVGGVGRRGVPAAGDRAEVLKVLRQAGGGQGPEHAAVEGGGPRAACELSLVCLVLFVLVLV